jgi:hypothetical protein
MNLLIYGKLKTDKKYRAFDYKNGVFVINLIRATLWDVSHRAHVERLVKRLRADNPQYEFEIRGRPTLARQKSAKTPRDE